MTREQRDALAILRMETDPKLWWAVQELLETVEQQAERIDDLTYDLEGALERSMERKYLNEDLRNELTAFRALSQQQAAEIERLKAAHQFAVDNGYLEG